MMGPTRKELSDFWAWFQKREKAFRSSKEPGVKFGDEIAENVNRFSPELGWEMGPGDDGIWEFVIRADPSEFRFLAKQVIDSAPQVPGWRFSRWRCPSNQFECIVEWQGRTFHVDQVTASVSVDPRYPLVEVELCSPGFIGKGRDEDLGPGYLLLDWMVGEQLVEEGIQDVTFKKGRGAIAANRIRQEVSGALAAARRRPVPAVSDQWVTLKGEKDGLPLFLLAAETLDLRLMPNAPWFVILRLAFKTPNEYGLPSKEELEMIQNLEDELVELAKVDRYAMEWGKKTSSGHRELLYYASDPERLIPALQSRCLDAGYHASILIDHDARWLAHRGWVDR